MRGGQTGENGERKKEKLMEPSGHPAMVESQAHSVSALLFHSFLRLMLFELSFPDHTFSPFQSTPSWHKKDHPAALPPVYYSITTFVLFF